MENQLFRGAAAEHGAPTRRPAVCICAAYHGHALEGHVLGRGAAVAVRSASSSRPASFAQQQQRASWVRGGEYTRCVYGILVTADGTDDNGCQRSGLINVDQLEQVALFGGHLRLTLQRHPHLGDPSQGRRLLYETIRQMLSAQVYDVIEGSRRMVAQAAPGSVQAVRLGPPLICFGDAMAAQSAELKQFLLRNLYRHTQVMETTHQARRIVTDLFGVYVQAPSEMQAHHAQRASRAPHASAAARVVADYIAGMTDRFAAREHVRLTGLHLLVAAP
jgi:hypothetical protein